MRSTIAALEECAARVYDEVSWRCIDVQRSSRPHAWRHERGLLRDGRLLAAAHF